MGKVMKLWVVFFVFVIFIFSQFSYSADVWRRIFNSNVVDRYGSIVVKINQSGKYLVVGDRGAWFNDPVNRVLLDGEIDDRGTHYSDQTGIDADLNDLDDWIIVSSAGALLKKGNQIETVVTDSQLLGRYRFDTVNDLCARINNQGDWLVVSREGIWFNSRDGRPTIDDETDPFDFGRDRVSNTSDIDCELSEDGHWIVMSAEGVYVDGNRVVDRQDISATGEVDVDIALGSKWIAASTDYTIVNGKYYPEKQKFDWTDIFLPSPTDPIPSSGGVGVDITDNGNWISASGRGVYVNGRRIYAQDRIRKYGRVDAAINEKANWIFATGAGIYTSELNFNQPVVSDKYVADTTDVLVDIDQNGKWLELSGDSLWYNHLRWLDDDHMAGVKMALDMNDSFIFLNLFLI